MFDLCAHKGLEGAGMTLRYAVAKTFWSDPKEKVTIHKGDIILILADIHGHHVVGITQTNNVEVFPSKVVRYLTKPRLVLRAGMVIRVKSVHNNYTRKLFKSTGELFRWQGMDGQTVLLDSYCETEGHTKTEDEYYYARSKDDGYSVAWEGDDNQGNDDYRNDRPMGTVKGLETHLEQQMPPSFRWGRLEGRGFVPLVQSDIRLRMEADHARLPDTAFLDDGASLSSTVSGRRSPDEIWSG
ncbi:hypothetical protein BSL78_13031 [Apostichopus japonicus]|uniref:Uncharacterized protein n=1 Tax=Stichopus japonicus TaxID=307972 RepID=A0A2G8KQ53_STIJA|nr:hypothetical protein BSL78_13031 [Apostichopus japonicus]